MHLYNNTPEQITGQTFIIYLYTLMCEDSHEHCIVQWIKKYVDFLTLPHTYNELG